MADTAENLVDVVDSCLHRHGIHPSEVRGRFGQPDGLPMPRALQTQQKRKRRRQGQQQQQEQQQQQAAPKLSIADQDRLCRITSTTWEEVKAAIISGLCAQAHYILQHAAAHISRAPALISSCWKGGAVGTANTQFIVHMQGQWHTMRLFDCRRKGSWTCSCCLHTQALQQQQTLRTTAVAGLQQQGLAAAVTTVRLKWPQGLVSAPATLELQQQGAQATAHGPNPCSCCQT
jgi:hypothetical protein